MATRLTALLVAVAENQDKAAFQALCAYFGPRLLGFLRSRGAGADVAEDIMQDTMVNIWRKASQFDPSKASAATWIFTIARNLRIDRIRKANRPVPDMNDPAFEADAEPLAHDIIGSAQEAQRLKLFMDQLPAEQQEVLRLAFFEDKTHSEVATALGLPLGTVKSRIRLATARLRSELGDKA